MENKKIKITVNGRNLLADEGEILADILIKNKFLHSQPCGGKGICGKCKLKINGEYSLACKYVIKKEISVELEEDDVFSESVITENEASLPLYELALDLGTTTIALALISPSEKPPKKVFTFNNPQKVFGADVISRIEYAKNHGVDGMTSFLREAISKKIAEISNLDGEINQFETIHIAGNTTMLHILLGINPSSMGVAPYTPVFLDEKWLDASLYSIYRVKRLHLLPSISAFVGADLTAGLNLVDFPDKKFSLLLDLGTNAEVILFSREKILATSAAAGPCFEGASISCGMNATKGAISAYNEYEIQTVENAPPVGICGTGLIDIIAYLLRYEIIDKTGYMEEAFQICEGVFITQDDVRQYQLAKSAIFSALITLIKSANIEFDDIEHLYISGGFSEKLNIENAIRSGLIPKELKNKFVFLGNSSLRGTIKSAKEKSDFSQIIKKAEYLDLSCDKFFCDSFIKNMYF